MKKKWILLLSLVLITSCSTLVNALDSEEDTQEIVAGQSDIVASENTEVKEMTPPVNYSNDFNIGVCLGKGAGLAGIFVAYRPIDLIGFEFAYGKRLFLLIEQTYSGSTLDTEIYWPDMWTGKVQFYFNEKKKRFQPGMELGYMSAADAGPGAELAGIFKFRISKNWTAEASAGFAYFFDMENSMYDYLVDENGGTRAQQEARYDLSSNMPFALMYGLAISVAF